MDMTRFGHPHYVTIADVRGSPIQAAILEVREGKYEKPDLLLSNGDAFSLNQGSRRALIRAYGPRSETWIGKVIELALGSVPFQGKPLESVIVHPVSKALSEEEKATGRVSNADKIRRTASPSEHQRSRRVPGASALSDSPNQRRASMADEIANEPRPESVPAAPEHERTRRVLSRAELVDEIADLRSKIETQRSEIQEQMEQIAGRVRRSRRSRRSRRRRRRRRRRAMVKTPSRYPLLEKAPAVVATGSGAINDRDRRIL